MVYFVTAIGTDSGKTLVSAILCKALNADYWKPVQAGTPTDSDAIRQLLGDSIKIHKEKYLLQTPASPHAAARIDGVNIRLADIELPEYNGTLIIEGAGGCMVPLNDREFVIDLATHFNVKVILVSNLYLGSINHTLLTHEALKNRGLTISGIIFNGEENPESERIILHHTNLPCLLRLRPEQGIDNSVVARYAETLRSNWNG